MSSLRKNLSASTYSTVAYLGGQLALTSVLLHFWSKETYAQWLILFTIPAYFALSDAGIANSFGNALAIAVEQKRSDDAVRMARAVWFWQIVFWAVVFAALLLGLAVLPLRTWMAVPEMSFPTFATVSVILALYALGSLFGGYYTALFRAGGEYARLVRLLGHLRVVEVVAHGTVAIAGGGLVAAAATLLATRVAFYAWCHSQRERLLPGVTRSGSRNWSEFRALLPSGLGFMAFPIGNALINQGAAILLKHLAGPGAVVVLNTGRQVARLFLNGVGILFQSIHPELSVAYAKGDLGRVARLQAQALTPVLWASPLFIGGMALAAPWAIARWTHGEVIVGAGLAAALAFESCAAGFGNAAMLAGWAINRLRELWVSYLVTQTAALVVAGVVYPQFGLTGLLLAFAGGSLVHGAVALWVAGRTAEVSGWNVFGQGWRGGEWIARWHAWRGAGS